MHDKLKHITNLGTSRHSITANKPYTIYLETRFTASKSPDLGLYSIFTAYAPWLWVWLD